MKKAANDIDRCVACGVCATQCPLGAISIYHGCYAKVDVNICVGCGICEKACPAGSIMVKEFVVNTKGVDMTSTGTERRKK